LIKDQLIKAGLGAAITKAIQNALSGYDSPVDKAVKDYVGQVASILITEKFSAQIKDAVAAAIETKFTDVVINEIVGAATERMVRAAHDRY
jgi:hypothetical protein